MTEQQEQQIRDIDLERECIDCRAVFVLSKRDQDFYAVMIEKENFVPPKRCQTCRTKRKIQRQQEEERKNENQ